jgi:hypothetical protein
MYKNEIQRNWSIMYTGVRLFSDFDHRTHRDVFTKFW